MGRLFLFRVTIQRLKPHLMGVPPGVHLSGRHPPAQAGGQPKAHQARLESPTQTI